MSAGCFNERPIKPLLAWGEHHEFRVPLHAKQKGRRRVFNGLDNVMFIACADAKPVSQAVDGLVVQRVHPIAGFANDAVKPPALDQSDGFSRQGRAQPWRAVVGFIDIGVERAAQRDIDHLGVPVNHEDGYGPLRGALQQLPFKGISIRINTDRGSEFAVVQIRIDIAAAAESQSVQPAAFSLVLGFAGH